MALIQNYSQKNGIAGNVWIASQINRNTKRRDDCVVTLELYKDAATREADKQADVFDPLPVSLVFVFDPQNNPITAEEWNVDGFNPDAINVPLDVLTHIVYVHIKDLAVLAHAKAEDERNENERIANYFYGAVDL